MARRKSLAATLVEQRNHDLMEVMGTTQGRRFLYWTLDTVCLMHQTVVGVTQGQTMQIDPYRTLLDNGRREAGLELLQNMKDVSPEYVGQMFAEALIEQTSVEEEDGGDEDRGDGEDGGDDTDDS